MLPRYLKEEYEIHYSSKDEIYQRLLEKFPSQKQHIHEILMPTPIDGKSGPSVSMSLLNVFLPVSKNPPLLKQISDYLREEGRLYDKEKFDLVINDGDMGSNVLAKNRGIPSVFVTNQFMPKLWSTRVYFYPSLYFIAKQIAKATTDKIKNKVTYVGHYANRKLTTEKFQTDLQRLIEGTNFGYWMRTGNRSTNIITGQKYEEIFHDNKMDSERRLVSHAKNDPTINKVLGRDGKSYSISEALEKKVDWLQIDIGFLSEHEKDAVLRLCDYVVTNGSHTVVGEIVGIYAKPIIGIPVYDEHTNNLRCVEEQGLGILARNKKQVLDAITQIKNHIDRFGERLEVYKKNFVGDGAQTTAKIVCEMLENNRKDNRFNQ
ncbi:MAG: glycosyltransferase [Nitrosopumilales archaeon]|nr:glycosyltransferase [Nitrosopumilales archaeon]